MSAESIDATGLLEPHADTPRPPADVTWLEATFSLPAAHSPRRRGSHPS